MSKILEYIHLCMLECVYRTTYNDIGRDEKFALFIHDYVIECTLHMHIAHAHARDIWAGCRAIAATVYTHSP